MPMFVKLARITVSSAVCVLLTVVDAFAVPVDEHDLARWVPSLALVVGLDAQSVEGHLGTSNVVGPPLPTPPPGVMVGQPITVGSPATSRDRMMTPYAGTSIELMTPAWFDVAGRPRAFAHVDVAVAFGPTYNIPSLGDLGPLRTSRPGGQTEATILGQGGRLQATVGALSVHAGAGIAFTLDVGDRALRIKPSVEYVREEVELFGVIQRAVQLTNPSPNLSDFRTILLSAQHTRVYHGIGPGLELELDTGRAGPLVVSLFGRAAGWSFLDNEKQNLYVVNEYGENVSFTFLKNQWAFGGTLGLRFRWVPEKQ